MTLRRLVAVAVLSLVLFPVAANGGTTAVVVAAGIGGVCHGVIVGGMSAFFVELFPTSARYTGFSLGYQMATVIAGARTPDQLRANVASIAWEPSLDQLAAIDEAAPGPTS